MIKLFKRMKNKYLVYEKYRKITHDLDLKNFFILNLNYKFKTLLIRKLNFSKLISK